jgi:hypothetical protein
MSKLLKKNISQETWLEDSELMVLFLPYGYGPHSYMYCHISVENL